MAQQLLSTWWQQPALTVCIPLYFPSTTSTHQWACQQQWSMPPSTVIRITAGAQTNGIGQHGRSFASPPGGLYTTFVLPWPHEIVCPLITLATASILAINVDTACRVKWQNDVCWQTRKFAGVLATRVPWHQPKGTGTAVVISFGMNIQENPALVQGRATTSCQEIWHHRWILGGIMCPAWQAWDQAQKTCGDLPPAAAHAVLMTLQPACLHTWSCLARKDFDPVLNTIHSVMQGIGQPVTITAAHPGETSSVENKRMTASNPMTMSGHPSTTKPTTVTGTLQGVDSYGRLIIDGKPWHARHVDYTSF